MTHLTEVSRGKRRDPGIDPEPLNTQGSKERSQQRRREGVLCEVGRAEEAWSCSPCICKKEEQVPVSDVAGKRKHMGTKTDHSIWQHGGHGDLNMISLRCNILMGVDLRKNRRGELETRSTDTPVRRSVVKRS